MTTDSIPIRFTDPSQEAASLQNVARDIAGILTPNEEILYIALQNQTALSIKKDSVVATSNRVILYQPQIVGRVHFTDYQWQDVKNTKIQQGVLATEFTVETVDGRKSVAGGLDKSQAKRLYGICQQMEQEWREKRRIRDMEEMRAKAGGVYMTTPTAPASAPTTEDPVEKLAKAKKMLDQKLISEAEYDALKAKILSSM
jgi:HPt (histidine-containing phosphotransfer) domain-containing protein